MDNREKSRECPSSSNNPVVSDNRRSDNRDLTVYQNLKEIFLAFIFQTPLFQRLSPAVWIEKFILGISQLMLLR